MSIREDIEKVESKMKKIEEESLAMELLKSCKKANARLFIIIIVILIMWFSTIGAFLYYINTTGFEEERKQEIEDIDDLSNSSIINGDVYGNDKTK